MNDTDDSWYHPADITGMPVDSWYHRAGDTGPSRSAVTVAVTTAPHQRWRLLPYVLDDFLGAGLVPRLQKCNKVKRETVRPLLQDIITYYIILLHSPLLRIITFCIFTLFLHCFLRNITFTTITYYYKIIITYYYIIITTLLQYYNIFTILLIIITSSLHHCYIYIIFTIVTLLLNYYSLITHYYIDCYYLLLQIH